MFTRSPNTLARALLLGLLFRNLSGSWAQVQLVETGGKLTYEGQNLTLTCTASGLRFKDFSFSWHWSSLGSFKEMVASITAGTGDIKEYRKDIQDRAFIFRNNEASTVSLTLHHLQKKDSGIYYCARLTGCQALSDRWDDFGPGTEVTVLPEDKIQLKELGGGPYPRSLTLSLKCQTSGFQFKTSILGWYLWNPGHAPRWLSSIDHTSAETNEGRIISSREDSSSQIFLQIKGLGLRDSGHYHCARRVGDGGDTDKLVFGPGTAVTVEPGPRNPLSPTVFLVRSKDAVACLVSDFYPKELHVSLVSPRTSVSAQALTVAPTAHGTYSAIHMGRVGENNSVTCSVKHLGKETLVSYPPGMSSPCLGTGQY
ncbi:immunoglobulin alpha-2 heavy chain-like [Trichosurus vulpecula]|uniref:immunoglobulin alpha-2 heavy chain-like n=1 Tax=Trichosurus vulpecula TaxID=9337 RepID=UPI00186B2B6F|nr:immunoglobulin alpha-2 heavy chain-like [Trichosurus vulpecula]